MQSLQRSRTRWSAESRLGSLKSSLSGLRFNGAALVGVRRAGPAHPVGQAAEVASTEPHSLECGESMAPTWTALRRWRFNGAALVGVRRASPLASAM